MPKRAPKVNSELKRCRLHGHAKDGQKIPVANLGARGIMGKMTLDRLLTFLAVAAAVAVAAVGCSGFQATKSVSPASFFLPGFMQNSQPTPLPFDLVTNPAPEAVVAQAR
jgi:hypothetical protein